mgnify:CR=1 FL=1
MDFFEYAAVASYFTNTLWAILLVGGLTFHYIIRNKVAGDKA